MTWQDVRSSATTTSTSPVTLTDRERIMAVLANPVDYGREVRDAIRVLVAAGRSTADPIVTWRTDTAGLSGSFQNLVDLMSDALVEVEGVEIHYAHPDVPQYVPADWADTLNVRAVEDAGFRLPWLEGLGEI